MIGRLIVLLSTTQNTKNCGQNDELRVAKAGSTCVYRSALRAWGSEKVVEWVTEMLQWVTEMLQWVTEMLQWLTEMLQ